LNISIPWHIHALGEIDISRRREWSKKSVQQDRSPFGARSVFPVREHSKRARTPLAAFFNIPISDPEPSATKGKEKKGKEKSRGGWKGREKWIQGIIRRILFQETSFPEPLVVRKAKSIKRLALSLSITSKQAPDESTLVAES